MNVSVANILLQNVGKEFVAKFVLKVKQAVGLNLQAINKTVQLFNSFFGKIFF